MKRSNRRLQGSNKTITERNILRVLQYAIRLAPLLKYFGKLCIAPATVTLVPFIVSLFFGDYRVSLRYSVVIMVVFFLGVGLIRTRAPKRIQTNEAMVITALIFIFSPLVMIWPVAI